MLDEPTADPQQIIAELRRERDEALEQQRAIAEVLKAISRSPSDLDAILRTVVRSAVRLCRADQAVVYRNVDGVFRWQCGHSLAPEYERIERDAVIRPGPGTLVGRAALEGHTVQIADAWTDPLYEPKEDARIAGVHSMLGVPVLRDGAVIGVLGLARQRIEPYSEREIELVTTFADQAVIAIENARLINETREALEQQTATTEVLEVINSSPGDLAPVFNVILEKALQRCDPAYGVVWRHTEGMFEIVAHRGVPEAILQARSGRQRPTSPQTTLGQVLAGKDIVHYVRSESDTLYLSGDPHRATAVGTGTHVGITLALRKHNSLLGAISVFRTEPRPFTEKEITLLQSFAAQAVIAIENARLINETREALEQQTATAELLQIINSSPGDLAPVFDAMLEKAMRLCEASGGYVRRYDGDKHILAAGRGLPEEFARYLEETKEESDTNTGNRLLTEPYVHIVDMKDGEVYRKSALRRAVVDLGGARTGLAVPLRKDGELIGSFRLGRQEVRPFSEKQIALVQNFATQAVIAIENARLLNKIRQRQAELRVTFDNMGDGVAMFDAQLRLAAWNRNFQRMLDLPDEFLETRPGFEAYFDYLAKRGEYGSTDLEARLRQEIAETGREARFERTRPDGRVVEVRRNPVPDGGFVLIYSDVTERKRAEAAIGAARDAAEQALSDLKTAQASLLHAQKMAALGQLTAGIAHEIKNPLNFVNNFAMLSNELLAELKDMAAPALAGLAADTSADIDETIEMLTGNLDKIAEHGKRADNIVKSMLAHSRGSSGERTQVDLNALLDEALNLAYHGARAHDQNFNITIERDFDSSLAPIELVPQDMMRVFINLIGNGFHAAHQRGQQAADPGFRPVLKVTTRDLGGSVEVLIRDNGTGIRAEYRDRLFQPFFTTKPSGEGTGLGLSISYDIVTQEHGGTITVESEPDSFTEFAVRLPRTGQNQAGRSQAEPAPLVDGATGRAA